jgi:predicted ATPase
MPQTADNPSKTPPQSEAHSTLGFTEIGVCGFKSFAQETRIQLGSLTILAGANSSGKSSIMQPLLMMKQTLEAPYDPGALLLDGPNVHFTSGEQMLSIDRKPPLDLREFMVFMDIGFMALQTTFHWDIHNGFALHEQKIIYGSPLEIIRLRADMSPDEIRASGATLVFDEDHFPQNLQVMRDRCFLKVKGAFAYGLNNLSFAKALQAIIHLPGLRGTPERLYKTSNVTGSTFIGQFDNYVASIINRFQKDEPTQLIRVQEALKKLGLTDIIQAQRLNDAQIELRVGRVLGADTTDTVNIADVGLGVSQILPVIVALLVAQPGQLVYIEQPEIHLHPRAQVALAEVFAEAASRGVRVVVETHSELFLMGIQALVAEDKLDPNAVKLHWFTRQADGSSKVTSADLDEMGAFGDWPEDFGSTSLGMTNRYLSAAEAKLWSGHNGNGSHG